MRQQSSGSMPGLRGEHDGRAQRVDGENLRRRCAEVAYAVFCCEQWPIYSRFAAVVTGNVSFGRDLARSVLEELGARWPAALRSASPAGYAWVLLTDALTPHRTDGVRTLYETVRAAEADALVLRHRLGCSAAVGGRVMGLSSDAFELLRRTALMKAA
ncbi:hypothetical protein [Streptomyces sp. NPDC046985]|uniref:hypothetical protein n=1 Tax=Streptomyces sp. NPDC046985 TaxID=3155377 RepID=UPI0033E99565